MPVSQELLEILACPKCKGGLRYDSKAGKLTCGKCRLRFKVLEGNLPDMLIEDAEKY